MGVFLKIEGEFLTIVSGIDTRHIVVVMTVILLLELVYTVLGGMVSVVITDFIQYVLLSVATILVSIYAVYHAGWGNIVAKVSNVMGNAGFDPIANPKFGVIFLVWQILLWFSIHTCWQTTAMRMFSTKCGAIDRVRAGSPRVTMGRFLAASASAFVMNAFSAIRSSTMFRRARALSG